MISVTAFRNSAHVTRNDPRHECDSGECDSNPFGAGGYVKSLLYMLVVLVM
jgi:hypothetical protein